MSDLLRWYHEDGQKLLHVIERAALLHVRFAKIHPFVDGNGRTARLLLNLELIKNGYPPVVIRKEERMDYYNALDKAHTTGDSEEFLTLVANENYLPSYDRNIFTIEYMFGIISVLIIRIGDGLYDKKNGYKL